MKRKVSIEFNYHDLWWGVFWKFNKLGTIRNLILYVCIIPVFPIKIQLTWHKQKGAKDEK
jgi:hypothetical protein